MAREGDLSTVGARGIGWYDADRPGFEVYKSLDDGDWERALRVNTLLHQALERWNYEALARNFWTLEGVLGHLARTKAIWGSQSGFGPVAIKTLVSSLANYLSSGRAYLDVDEATWKRQYGKGSAQVASLKSITSAEFDSNAGYRFTYKLRNMVQHVGLAGLALSLDADASESKTLQVLAERDSLVAAFDWGAIVASDLRALPATFDMYPLLVSGFDGFQRIERAVTREMLRWTVSDLPWMTHQVEALPLPPRGIPVLLSHSGAGEPGRGDIRLSHSTVLLPTDMRRLLSALEADDLTSLHFAPTKKVHNTAEAVATTRFAFAAELVSPAILGDMDTTNDRIRQALDNPTTAAKAIVSLVDMTRLLLAEESILTDETPISILERYIADEASPNPSPGTS